MKLCGGCQTSFVEYEDELCEACTKAPEEDDDSGSLEESPKPIKRRKLDVRKKHDNLIQPSSLTLGVVTWNVAHFGEGELAVLSSLSTVWLKARGFENDWKKKKAWNPGVLATKLVEYLDNFELWECRFGEACGENSAFRKASRSARAKLSNAAARHCRIPESKATEEEEEEDSDDEQEEGEAAALEDGADDPAELARLLAELWTKYDGRHSEGEWAKKKTLIEEWTTYFEVALQRYGEAWESFKLEWGFLHKEKSEDVAQQDLLDDMSALVLSTKDLRAAAKMVVKPILQLRERISFAKKAQAAAVAKVKKVQGKLKEADDALTEAKKISTSWRVGPVFTSVEALDKMIHRVLVAVHIDLMFRQNSWLDAIILHEVNKGISTLEKYLDGKGYQCIRGFTLQSKSGKGSQTEYYPLVLRKNGRVRVNQLLAVYNDGGSISENDVKQSPPLAWNKKKDIYRPILAYDVWVQTSDFTSELVTLGVVHTSPSGREMNREKVFDQVDIPLMMLSQSSIPVVVGGDFYLTEEAVTVGWNALGEEGQKKADLLKEEYSKPYRQRLSKINEDIKKLEGPPQKSKKRKRVTKKKDDEEKPGKDDEEKKKELIDLQKRKKALLELIDSLSSDRIQLIRNDGELAISVGQRVRKLGMELAQPITGTNWKSRSVLAWLDAQIADFFVHTGPKSLYESSRWAGSRVGLVSPTGGMRLADAEELYLSKYWRCASDHFPVGIILTKSWNPLILEKPFLGLREQITFGVRPQDPSTRRNPREVLGIRNQGNTCYVNAALQLTWRIGLQANYVTGLPGPDFRSIVDEVNGILGIHRNEGQSGTYGAYGRDHFYTTADTIGLRVELTLNGAALGIFAQSDAGEALQKMLEAFEHPVVGFSPGNHAHLVQSMQAGDFLAKRPSKCHFMMEVTTLYTLGEAQGPPRGALPVDDEAVATTYRCANVLSLHLPPEDPPPLGPEDLEDEGTTATKISEEDEEESSESLEPVSYGDLIQINWSFDYGEDNDETTAVDSALHHFPKARAKKEDIAVAVFPDHWIVQLERFVHGGQHKKVRKVTMPGALDGRALKGFIVHLGETATGGHYIAYLEHNGTWYCLNDDRVIENPPDLQDARSDAYILYYE